MWDRHGVSVPGPMMDPRDFVGDTPVFVQTIHNFKFLKQITKYDLEIEHLKRVTFRNYIFSKKQQPVGAGGPVGIQHGQRIR